MKQIKFICSVVIITCVIVFMAGMHNIDLAYNFRGQIDCNGFVCQTMEQIYVQGTIEIYASMVVLALIGTFINSRLLE